MNTHLATTVESLSFMQMLSRGFTIVWGTCSIVASLTPAVFYMISDMPNIYCVYKMFLTYHLVDIICSL